MPWIRIVIPTEFKSAKTNEFKSNRVYFKTYMKDTFRDPFFKGSTPIKNQIKSTLMLNYIATWG